MILVCLSVCAIVFVNILRMILNYYVLFVPTILRFLLNIGLMVSVQGHTKLFEKHCGLWAEIIHSYFHC